MIGYFRGAAYDNRGNTAHVAFSAGAEGLAAAQQAVSVAITRSIWIEPDVRDHLVALNRLMIKAPHDGTNEEIFAAGSAIYREVGALRERLEAVVARNLQDLHQIRVFLKRKEKAAKTGQEPRLEMLPKYRDHEA